MNKQIDDMRGDLIEIFDKEYDERRLITPHNTAEKLTALGYRKQSDVAREVISEILYAEQRIHRAYINNSISLSDEYKIGYFNATNNFLKMLAELRKKYESEGADDEEV